MKSKMSYVHYRKERATGLCDRTEVHTTKKKELVTCCFCKDMMKKNGVA